jgi:hypothetical protein
MAGFLREAADAHAVPCAVEVVEAYPAMASREAVASALAGASVLAVATPTYAQGSPWYVRRFFELSAGLAEVLATRMASRPAGLFRDLAIAKKLNLDVLRIRRPEEIQLDGSELSPAELATKLVCIV